MSSIFSQGQAEADGRRYLPPYRDTVIPYTLRLPTYRSSYARRYHPYARYFTVRVEEDDLVDGDRDSEIVLDLAILVPQIPLAMPVNNLQLNPIEELVAEEYETAEVIVNPADMEDGVLELEDQENDDDEQHDGNIFLRADIEPLLTAFETLHFD
ncbi:hypothetical protein AX17_000427 [Amanita inopinata Kibby_2008]|nr:hypothetical protein AX17_000427 [Amanita inopinata Kibby_2008]